MKCWLNNAGDDEEIVVFQGHNPALVVQLFYTDAVTDRNRLVLGKDGCAGIAFFLGIVPILVVAGKRKIQLAFRQLGFLQAEKVCICFLKKVQKPFLYAGPQAVNIPGYQLHIGPPLGVNLRAVEQQDSASVHKDVGVVT